MNRVFVLGSGFSTYAGAPVSRGVLPAIFAPERQSESTVDLKNFLTEFLFKGRSDWVNTSGLEEVLSRLDLIRHYQPYPNIDYNQVSHFEELLLEEFIKLLTPQNVNSTHSVYLSFGRLIHPRDTIISFNYDLITEALLNSSALTYCYHHSPDENTGNWPADAASGNRVALLKLHGSVNLYYCPECGMISEIDREVTEETPCVNKNSVTDNFRTCTRCSSGSKHVFLRHFIVAPTLFKSYTLPTLRQLWFKAMKSLEEADKIIFIGYSLPEADILSYQLFDFGRKLSDRLQEVYLINGARHVPARFAQLYGDNLHNTKLYLDQWLHTVKQFPW